MNPERLTAPEDGERLTEAEAQHRHVGATITRAETAAGCRCRFALLNITYNDDGTFDARIEHAYWCPRATETS